MRVAASAGTLWDCTLHNPLSDGDRSVGGRRNLSRSCRGNQAAVTSSTCSPRHAVSVENRVATDTSPPRLTVAPGTPLVVMRSATGWTIGNFPVASGELTRRETRALAGEQRDIRQLERAYKSDGELTRAERADL